MQGMTTAAGKLLIFIYRLHKEGKITVREQGLLKDLVVAASPPIFHALAKYEQEGTELTLTSHLIRLLRAAKAEETPENSSHGSRVRRAISVTIPLKSIQKLPHVDDRV